MKSRWKNIVFWISLLLLGPVVMFGIYQNIGPRGPIPAQNPMEALSALAAGFENNAARNYERAARLVDEAWVRKLWTQRDEDLEQVPPDLLAWIAGQSELIGELDRAAAKECRLEFSRTKGGYYDSVPPFRNFPVFHAVLALRARAAAERHDLPDFRRAIEALDALARHLDCHAASACVDAAAAIQTSRLTLALLPFEWDDVSTADRVDYAAHLVSWDDSTGDVAAAIRFGRDYAIWVIADDWAPQRMVFRPSSRVAGELDGLLAPHLRIADLPVDAQTPELFKPGFIHSTTTFREEFRTHWDASFNQAEEAFRDPEQLLQRNAFNVTRARGTRAVAAVWRHRLELGEFPTTLADAGAAGIIDPFGTGPFAYACADDGFKLYSVAANRRDDGGRHHPEFGWSMSHPLKRDFVIWPVQRPEPREEESAEIRATLESESEEGNVDDDDP